MSKYGAKKTILDGITFDSKGESQRYAKLKIMEKAMLISGLKLQPKYPLTVNGSKVGTYIADFEYIRDGITTTEDFKGYRTPEYKLKAKLFKAIYGYAITETSRADL